VITGLTCGENESFAVLGCHKA